MVIDRMVKIIIFDLGSVVLTGDWHHISKKFREDMRNEFGTTEEDYEKGYQSIWRDFNIGKMIEEEFWNSFFEITDAKNRSVDKAKEIWRRYHHFLENMQKLVKKLKENYKVVALSNIPKEFLDFKREKFNLDSLFEIIVASGYVGQEKPNKEIFSIILEKLDAKPMECLFIDDKEININTATGMGMNAILFKGQSDLEKALKKIGIKFI